MNGQDIILTFAIIVTCYSLFLLYKQETKTKAK